jgi:hypothetical protein
MDEGRKRTLWICAAILSERRLSALEDGKSAALQTEITQDAISKAERSCARLMRAGRAMQCQASRNRAQQTHLVVGLLCGIR